MKLLVINPNISESVTALIGTEARLSASQDTVITAVTASMGVAYIETRFEALIGAYAVAEQIAHHLPGHDGVVVAAFGDPGLMALREALSVPVTGMTEAALATACQLGTGLDRSVATEALKNAYPDFAMHRASTHAIGAMMYDLKYISRDVNADIDKNMNYNFLSEATGKPAAALGY